MSDDLVKRLRSQIGDDVREIYSHEALFRLAADRIEELEAERDEARKQARMSSFMGEGYAFVERRAIEAEARADAAEAKLREAVEITRSLLEALKAFSISGGAIRDAEAFLARLTGETQDGGDDE